MCKVQLILLSSKRDEMAVAMAKLISVTGASFFTLFTISVHHINTEWSHRVHGFKLWLLEITGFLSRSHGDLSSWNVGTQRYTFFAAVWFCNCDNSFWHLHLDRDLRISLSYPNARQACRAGRPWITIIALGEPKGHLPRDYCPRLLVNQTFDRVLLHHSHRFPFVMQDLQHAHKNSWPRHPFLALNPSCICLQRSSCLDAIGSL